MMVPPVGAGLGSLAVGLEPLVVGVALPVRVGVSQQVHYPSQLFGGELVGQACRYPLEIGCECVVIPADSAVLLGLGDPELVPALLRVQALPPLPGEGLAWCVRR